MPKPDVSLSAVVVSGGKQYRVGLGDRILVDRMAAEPGSSVKLGRVLLFTNGGEIKVGKDAGEFDVDAKVIAHERGPRIESIRYKSKKRVRVHRGGRAHLTALEIIAVGGVALETKEREEAEVASKPKRGKAKAEPKPKKAAPVAEAKEEEAKEMDGKTPKKPTRRRTKKESE